MIVLTIPAVAGFAADYNNFVKSDKLHFGAGYYLAELKYSYFNEDYFFYHISRLDEIFNELKSNNEDYNYLSVGEFKSNSYKNLNNAAHDLMIIFSFNNMYDNKKLAHFWLGYLTSEIKMGLNYAEYSKNNNEKVYDSRNDYYKLIDIIVRKLENSDTLLKTDLLEIKKILPGVFDDYKKNMELVNVIINKIEFKYL